MSTLKVDNIRHNSATSDAITMASDGTCTAKLTSIGGGQLSHRNLIINGAMMVAQRGVTSTVSGFGSVDRFRLMFGGQDEALTQAQHTLSTSDTPYSLGFRYSFHITNGNQTSGAGGTDYAQLLTTIEAQDIASSGWNYTSSSSFITLSFWVKSSVAQNFYGAVRTQDGTVRSFPFETGSLTADTWKKVIIKIPGDSSNTFNNDNGAGLQIFVWAFRGTDYTGSVTLNQWNTWNTSTGTPDFTSTWWTTNDATLEFTGYQLEVGDTATSFEHKRFSDELNSCLRYFWKDKATQADHVFCTAANYTSSNAYARIDWPVPMRGTDTGITIGYSALSDFKILGNNSTTTGLNATSMQLSGRVNQYGGQLYFNGGGNLQQGGACHLRAVNTNAYISYECEI
tara:strand:- start:43 stop:1233 length:1191 start_codon:yes stop_codon:yes gene_type:complete